MRRIGYAILGAATGMVVVAAGVGAWIGLEQSDLWPVWITVPLGLAMGPSYLVFDIGDLLSGHWDSFITLPQALPGGAIGAALGWWWGAIRARRSCQVPEGEK